MSNVPELTKFFLSEDWTSQLNRTNPLGMKGQIAETYAELIQTMWDGKHSSTAPRRYASYLTIKRVLILQTDSLMSLWTVLPLPINWHVLTILQSCVPVYYRLMLVGLGMVISSLELNETRAFSVLVTVWGDREALIICGSAPPYGMAIIDRIVSLLTCIRLLPHDIETPSTLH